MSKTLDALRWAEAGARSERRETDLPGWRGDRAFRVVSVSSNKGGVGKTTVAANLAVYLRALREDDPVLMVGFDDQTSLDRMFALDLDAPTAGEDLEAGLRSGSLSRVARFGQYGVEYVPSSRDVPKLRALVDGPAALQRVLLASKRTGTVVLDTKSDFEVLTRASILSSDLAIVVVKDQASLIEAKRVFDLLEAHGRPRSAARVLLSLVDLRVKYREGDAEDVLGHLLSEIRRLEYPVFETFISRSPKVESLHTNPEGRAHAILNGAEQTVVHRQMRQLTREVDAALDPPPRRAPAAPTYTNRSPFGGA